MKKWINRWIAHKKYMKNTYGWFHAIIGEPFEDMIEIPFEKTLKVIRWIPVIWKVREWEGSDTLKVIDFHLSRVQKNMKEDPYHCERDGKTLSGPRYAKEVQEVRDCITRLREDDYCKQEQKIHDKKFGKLTMKPDYKNRRSVGNSGAGTVPVIFKPDSPAANKSRNKIWKLEEERKLADRKKLFDILRKKLWNWYT